MEVTLKENAPVLLPNKQYQNFSESHEIILAGSKINGEPKYITGVRKNKPYTYRLFLTDDNKLIHLDKAIPKSNQQPQTMNKTEVTLGADGGGTSGHPETVLNLKPAQNFSKTKLIGAAAGATLGFLYARYKKHDLKHSGKHILIGAIVGYVAAYFIDAHHTATINKATNKA